MSINDRNNGTLPKGWIDAKLNDIGLTTAKSIKPSDTPNEEYELWSVPTYPTNQPEKQLGKNIGSNKIEVQENDVLLCKINPRINRVWRVRERGEKKQIASTEWILFRTEAINPNFLRYRFMEPSFRQELCSNISGVGGSLTRARPQIVKNLQISIAPLNEQKRIADKIEALQAKSNKAKQALETAKPLLDKLRQSILAAAFRGDLTADWRKKNPDVEPASILLERIRKERRKRWEETELAKMKAKGKEPENDKWKAKYKKPEPVDTTGLPELPEGWCWVSLGELISSIDAGKSPNASSIPAKDNESGVLKVSAVSWGEFLPNENKALPKDYSIEGKPTINKGDLIISRANTVELVGAVVVAKENYPNLMLSDKTLRMNIVSHTISSQYLKYALRTKTVRLVFEDQATGTSNSMRNLSQGKILSAPIALSPAKEQERILTYLISTENSASETLKKIKVTESLINYLDRSILTKAFQGELVPQDPTDEPASVLLDRIKAEREAMQPKKKATRKLKAKAV